MRKEFYDVLITARDSVEGAVERLDSVFETVDTVLEEVAANVTVMAAGLLDKIDEILEANPVEDVVNTPRKSFLDDLLSGSKDSSDNLFKGPWVGTDDVSDLTTEGKHANRSTGGVSREEKVTKIAEYIPAWRDVEYVSERSDREVDVSYTGVLFGEKLARKLGLG